MHDTDSSPDSTAAPNDASTAPIVNHPGLTAAYDPGDNKLRLRSAFGKLPPEIYERVRAAGFQWAPRQNLFVAPAWSPEREDLLLALCGELGDEDTTLVERAEKRADRFATYSDKRADDAHRARAGVDQIADGIPFGQPILVGHHSERHARRDAERITAGMRRAVSMWETSKYWAARAAGAVRSAKYKERPDVRHRRIKGIETTRRLYEKRIVIAETFLRLWSAEPVTLERALKITNYDNGTSVRLWSRLSDREITPDEAMRLSVAAQDRTISHARRWIAHLDNRLAYERALLEESGGATGGAFDPSTVAVGGRVLLGSPWAGWPVVTRVVKKDGAVVSVRAGRGGVRGIEECRGYEPPTAEQVAATKAAIKLPPLVNRPSDGCRVMTKAEWAGTYKDYKGSRISKATDAHGAYRYRTVVSRADLVPVFLSDAKVDELPPPAAAPRPELPPAIPVVREIAARPAPEPTVFDAMKESLRNGGGVRVVVADQLFPTPDRLADRVIAAAGIRPGHRVLEPSAGTGALVAPAIGAGGNVTAVEINGPLADRLRTAPFRGLLVHCADFLDLRPCDLGVLFDCVVMNPPFSAGGDVEHVMHAYGFLRPGGRLVAIMAAGVRFRQDRDTAAFRELVALCGGVIEDLHEDSFSASGTKVRTVLVTMEAR